MIHELNTPSELNEAYGLIRHLHPQLGKDDFIIHFVGNTKHLMKDWRSQFNFYQEI